MQPDRISIHAPVKGATCLDSMVATDTIYFNPRSREGSDTMAFFMFAQPVISIHAPVKGATVQSSRVALTHRISIHAPVKGATNRRHQLPGQERISIHAPVKGATTISPLMA